MLVLHGHTSGPFGAVYVKVIVQLAPGQLDMVPQTVWLPKSVLLMKTSTPAPPAVQVSVPSSSVAPTIFASALLHPGGGERHAMMTCDPRRRSQGAYRPSNDEGVAGRRVVSLPGRGSCQRAPCLRFAPIVNKRRSGSSSRQPR
jgi:hypothetical protein